MKTVTRVSRNLVELSEPAAPIRDFRPVNGQTRVHPPDGGLFVDR